MNVAVVIDGVERELSLDLNHDQGSVGELVAALAGAGSEEWGLLVDGRFVPPSSLLADAGLRQGSLLQPAPAAEATPGGQPAVEVRMTGGLEAGRTVPLAPGVHRFGRDPTCDVAVGAASVSAVHATLDVKVDGTVVVDDADSKNGTAIEGYVYADPILVEPGQVVQTGAVQFTVARPDRSDVPLLGRPRRNGTVTFNRPPRALPSDPATALEPPAPPREPATGMRFPMLAMLAPVIFGLGMALLTPVKQMAFFALLSPVMMGANWLEDRRRIRREQQKGSSEFAENLKSFRRAIVDARMAEVARRRSLLPDPAEVVRRAMGPSTRLWERRPAHGDFLRVSCGTATQAWTPTLDPSGAERTEAVVQAIRELGWLPLAPLEVNLSPRRALGLVGERAPALAVARSLICQAAVHHGPADLRIAVLTEPDRAADWDWVKWLPHTHSLDESSGRQLLAATAEDVAFVLDELLASRPGTPSPAIGPAPGAEPPPGPVTLVVIDAEGLTEGRNAPARDLLAGAGQPASGLVLAASVDRLPALCTEVLELVGGEGVARYRVPASNLEVREVLAAGVAEPLARQAARALAGLEDPEVPDLGADLPAGVSLVDLLGIEITPDALAARWKAAGPVPRVTGPIGVYGEGTLEIDLVTDGPHGLIAGTTGSGKSELLRSLVAGLAAGVDAEHLNFVLIDYKGGAAFAECADLPHTVGMVTDLDEHLGQRALRCLEAELRYREQRLRDAGVSDLKEYLRERPGDALPRLLVVIDEFATMAAELPDFIDSLVGVAQRGRSLGVHMLLATQRPGGAVNDNIRANTNLRIALRVQDAAESTDVVGSPLAATIGRKQPGRGYIRLGPSEVFPFQTALVTGTTTTDEGRGIDVARFVFGPDPVVADKPPPAAPTQATADAPTDLERLVAAAGDAHRRAGLRPPRRPWPDPLPERVLLDDLDDDEAETAAPLGLADDPDRQTRRVFGWNPTQGNLLLCGVSGSGTSTALVSLGVSLARTYPVDRLHFYVLDFGTQVTAPLAALPHCGGVVGSADKERQVRLIRHLAGELERRRRYVATSGAVRFDPSDPAAPLPAVVLLLDNYPAFFAAFDPVALSPLRDVLVRIIADGPGLGITTVVTTDRPSGVQAAVTSVVPNKVVFRLGDSGEYSFFGLNPREIGKLPPGRAIDVGSRLELQVALPGPDSLPVAVEAVTGSIGPVDPAKRPAAIGTLPTDVALDAVAESLQITPEEWLVPLGLGDTTLAPVGLRMAEGEHAFIAGAPRAGKSTTLDAIAALIGSRHPEVVITAVALRRSPLQTAAEPARVITSAEELSAGLQAVLEERNAPQLVLIDDAESVEDPSGYLPQLVAAANVHIVAAGRADALKGNYMHWSTAVRKNRQGMILKPGSTDDGNLWGIFLPSGGPTTFEPGRGYLLVDGAWELAQAAHR
jgi:S-DNA-T family DNA segregation ATPase FtsK/SpoIIIE